MSLKTRNKFCHHIFSNFNPLILLYRVNFGPLLSLANPGDSLAASKRLVRKEAATDVFIERSEPLPEWNEAISDSFESWLEVELENSVLSFDHDSVPKLEVVDGLNALHAHADEAERQLSITGMWCRIF